MDKGLKKRVKGWLAMLILAAAAIAAACILIGFYTDSGTSTEEDREKIIFQGTHIMTSHSSAVRVEANKVTILKAGTYVLEGNLSDGQIIVDAGPEDQVVLKFNNLSAYCSDSSPLWIRRADKVKIRLKDDSVNQLSDGEYYKPTEKGQKQARACIDARCDINIKGEKGSLTIKSAYRDGIRTSDDLKIKSGTIKVEAARHGLMGKDSVQIEDGNLDVIADRDGIHSDGFLKMSGGQVQIRAGRYGLYAYEDLVAKPPGQIRVISALSKAGCRGKIDVDQCLVEDDETHTDQDGEKPANDDSGNH